MSKRAVDEMSRMTRGGERHRLMLSSLAAAAQVANLANVSVQPRPGTSGRTGSCSAKGRILLMAGGGGSGGGSAGGGSAGGGSSAGGSATGAASGPTSGSPTAAGSPDAGSTGAGSASVSGVPNGPGNPGSLNNSVNDPSGAGNASKVPSATAPGTNSLGHC